MLIDICLLTVQFNILKNLIDALTDSIENENYSNEATFKHNFFYYLKMRNRNYNIKVEESLSKHIKLHGRADYYLDDQTNSYRNDVVIEFKINCMSKKLILHDITKLENIKLLNDSIACIFINVFTYPLEFSKYLDKIKKLFESTNIYCVTYIPEIRGFSIKNSTGIITKNLKHSFIINNARFIETGLIPTKFNVIRLPNKGGMLKNIHLYPARRKRYRERTKNGYIDSKVSYILSVVDLCVVQIQILMACNDRIKVCIDI